MIKHIRLLAVALPLFSSVALAEKFAPCHGQMITTDCHTAKPMWDECNYYSKKGNKYYQCDIYGSYGCGYTHKQVGSAALLQCQPPSALEMGKKMNKS